MNKQSIQLGDAKNEQLRPSDVQNVETKMHGNPSQCRTSLRP